MLKQRGAAARPLLADVGDMMSAAQPKDQEPSRVKVDREAIVHHLAAEAVLAIAAPDDPWVARAQAVLRATGSPK